MTSTQCHVSIAIQLIKQLQTIQTQFISKQNPKQTQNLSQIQCSLNSI